MVDSPCDPAALIALLRSDSGWWARVAGAAADPGGVESLLEAQLGLLAGEARARAQRELDRWREREIEPTAYWDPAYPPALAATVSPPPLLFIAGQLAAADRDAVAVVGSRMATGRGVAAAGAVARRLVADGFTVVSGLATGIDAAAHEAALGAGGRTLAVIGCGLDHVYPPQHAELQRRIAATAAVVSQFWPATRPTRRTFPMRNGVMAGLTRATVIVEASATSGTRIQARLALAEGRAVLLLPPALEQPWARDLATRPGVHVVRSPAEVSETLARLLTRALSS